MFRYQSWATVCCVASMLSASAALAGEPKKGEPEPPIARPAVDVTWEQFKQQCQDPMRGDVQRAPQEVRLVCTDQLTSWVASAPGEVALKSSRSVSTAVVSDKFKVAASVRDVEALQRPGTCHRFKEVVETFTTEFPVTCDELINGKQEVQDLCLGKIDDSKEKNPKIIDIQETGKFVDTCAAIQKGGDGREPGPNDPSQGGNQDPSQGGGSRQGRR